ncbi:MAG: type IX secretion system protein PorQ [Caldithrix sp.]|nr:type IX secretion system protein PorQ [Caldithrix sp.]
MKLHPEITKDKSMMRRTMLVIIILISVRLAVSNNGLTSGFEFLRTDFSPRTAAMSNAYLAVRGDINGLTVNPAGLTYAQEDQFSFNYTNYLLDISGGSAGYARVLQGAGVIGVGIQYMDFGTFDEINEYAESTGQTFSASDMAITVGYSDYLDQRFTYGVNVKYVYSKIEQFNASAVAMDFGLMWKAPFKDHLHLAFSVLNLGHNFEKYGTRKESLPMSVRLGFTNKLEHLPLELAMSINDLNVQSDNIVDRLLRFSVGGEFTLSELLRLRLGYNHELNDGLSTDENSKHKFGGLSGGLGIFWQKFRFDFAYSNYGGLGTVYRVGIRGALPLKSDIEL